MKNSNEEIKVDENLEEIIHSIEKLEKKKKNTVYSNEEKDKNELQMKFLQLLDEIDLSSENYRSIFVNGKEELIYDNGEFFICSATDFKKPKKKKTRKEATDLYIEYFIRYQLNPLFKEKQLNNISEILSKETSSDNIKEVNNKKTPVKSKKQVDEKIK